MDADPNGSSVPFHPCFSVPGLLAWACALAVFAAGAWMFWRGRHAAAALAEMPAEPAVLARPVARVDAAGAPLRDVIAGLGRSMGTRVVMDGIDPLLPAGAMTPCTMKLQDVTLGTALRAACDPLIPGHGSAVQLWADRTSVHVGPGSSAPHVVRWYPLGDLLPRFQAELERHAAAEAAGLLARHGGVSNSLGPPPVPYANRTAADELLSLITDTIRTDEWSDNGGSLGDVKVGGGRLWVCQTPEGHAAVRSFLAMLESTTESTTQPATMSAADATVPNPHANLAQQIPELDLDSTTLERGIDRLRDLTHANIVVYWNDLEAAGVKRDTPIKLHLWDVTIDRALGAMLSVAGADLPRAVQDGIITVGSPERLRAGSMALRMYDVRDLVRTYCAHHPPVPVTGQNKLTAMDPDKYATDPAQDAVDELVHSMEDLIDADSWKDNGGSIGAIREFDGRLFITQTPAAHRQIADFLAKLREGGTRDGQPTTRP